MSRTPDYSGYLGYKNEPGNTRKASKIVSFVFFSANILIKYDAVICHDCHVFN